MCPQAKNVQLSAQAKPVWAIPHPQLDMFQLLFSYMYYMNFEFVMYKGFILNVPASLIQTHTPTLTPTPTQTNINLDDGHN